MTVAEADMVAREYFDAWQARDAERFRALLADDVTWEGPSWRADGADACMRAFAHASGRVASLEIHRVWSEGAEVLTWLVVERPGATPMPVANWMHIKAGRVAGVRATADLLPPA